MAFMQSCPLREKSYAFAGVRSRNPWIFAPAEKALPMPYITTARFPLFFTSEAILSSSSISRGLRGFDLPMPIDLTAVLSFITISSIPTASIFVKALPAFSAKLSRIYHVPECYWGLESRLSVFVVQDFKNIVHHIQPYKISKFQWTHWVVHAEP